MVKARLRIISAFLAVLGVALIIFSIYPIVEYEFVSRKRFPRLVSPMSVRERYFILFAPKKDYKDFKNWSSEYELNTSAAENSGKYFLSIPRLGIKNAAVFEGGEDLSKSLIQYPGTSRPGQIGNTVIFGHSILPVFFNPQNYLSIFSTIPKLKMGDEIFVDTDNVKYKYTVSEMFEVEPDNLDILDQKVSNSYLSLVTCVPPGHPLKPRRLVVKAELTEI